MKLSSLSEIMQIGDSLFSASSFGRDHSELEISRKDDGDAYCKMQYLRGEKLNYKSVAKEISKPPFFGS